MMPITIAAAAAIVGAVAAVGGTVYSIQASQEASEQQRRMQDAQSRRERRQAIRRAQIERAQALAATQGATGSIQGSGILGGLSAQASTLGSAIGYQTSQAARADRIASAQGAAELGSGIASIGGFLMGNANNLQAGYNSLFGPQQGTPTIDASGNLVGG